MKVDWKETFNPHDAFGSLNSALDEAHVCGYPYVYWNGNILDIRYGRKIGTADEEHEVYINGVKHTNKGGEK